MPLATENNTKEGKEQRKKQGPVVRGQGSGVRGQGIVSLHAKRYTLKVVLFDFAVECSFADAEDFRGFFTVAPRFRQRVHNSLLLQFI